VLHIVSGSENEFLAQRPVGSTEPTFKATFEQAHLAHTLDCTFMGSVDIKNELQKGKTTEFDVAFPANQIWFQLGDTKNVVSHSQLVMLFPVVFVVKRSIAERLVGIARTDLTTNDILNVVASGEICL
jgi:hypothetical protein